MFSLPRSCRDLRCLLITSTAWVVLSVGSASAQVLLFNAGGGTGINTGLTGSSPYSVAAGSTWNQGGATYTSPLKYANGDDATGVQIVGDGGQVSSGSAAITFAEANGSAVPGNVSSGIFSNAPALSSFYNGTGSSTVGVFGYRVSGLAYGLYDVYVVAAYTGQNSTSHPSSTVSANPARSGVFVFGGSAAASLSYNFSGGTGSITGAGSSVSSYQILTNKNNGSWEEDVNFERYQVAIDVTNPNLYVVVSADKSGLGLGGSSPEQRAFLNMVQIVTVPEPGAAALLGLAGVLVVFRRRR